MSYLFTSVVTSAMQSSSCPQRSNSMTLATGEKGLGERLYSPECVEGEFCELRHDGVLRSSALPWCSGAYTCSSERRMLRSSRGQQRCRVKAQDRYLPSS